MRNGYVQKEYENFADQIEDGRVRANIGDANLNLFIRLLFENLLYNIVTLENCMSYPELMQVCRQNYPRIAEWAKVHRHQCDAEIRAYSCEPIASLASLYINKNLSQEERMQILDTYACKTTGMSIGTILRAGHLQMAWNKDGDKMIVPLGAKVSDVQNSTAYEDFCGDPGIQLETIGRAMWFAVNE